MNMIQLKKMLPLIAGVILSTVLIGCDAIKEYQEQIDVQSILEVSGSVSDGPIINASIRAENLNGLFLGKIQSDDNANYNLSLLRPKIFPVILESRGGIDVVTYSVPDFNLSSVIYDANTTIANLNPFSTLVVNTARNMAGGITKENLFIADSYLSKNLNFGMNRILIPDPISTAVSPTNIAVFVKSSKSLTETLRRTSEILIAKGFDLGILDIIDNLSADLADGVIDGKSSASILPEASAIFSLVSAQTIIESIHNELQVKGVDATQALNDAIKVAMPDAPSWATTGNVLLTKAELSQAKMTLYALKSVTNNSDIDAIISDLALLSHGMKSSETKAYFQSDAVTILAAAMQQVIAATPAQLKKANDVVYESIMDGTPDPEPTPTPSPEPNPAPEPTPSPGSGFDITNLTNLGYQFDTLEAGIAMYTDRAYTILSVPSQYVGSKFIRTKNNDKNATGDNFLSFDLSLNGTVFVAYDRRIAILPNWLSTWTATGATLVVSDNNYIFDIYKKDFAAGTVTLGGNVGGGNSMYMVFAQLSAVSGEIPLAKPDVVATDDATAIEIIVLANDTNLADTPIFLSVDSQPAYGTATINTNNSITYAPNGSYIGDDSFTYKIIDKDGDFSVSTVSVTVNCSNCANGVMLSLTWDANPDEESITGYNLYAGSDASSITSLTKTLNVGDTGFNSTVPGYSLDAGVDLQLRTGDNICFKISALNYGGESSFSNVICLEI